MNWKRFHHGDIQPGNILLDDVEKKAYITDFGLTQKLGPITVMSSRMPAKSDMINKSIASL